MLCDKKLKKVQNYVMKKLISIPKVISMKNSNLTKFKTGTLDYSTNYEKNIDITGGKSREVTFSYLKDGQGECKKETRKKDWGRADEGGKMGNREMRL